MSNSIIKNDNIIDLLDANHCFDFIPSLTDPIIFKKSVDSDGVIECYPNRTIIDARNRNRIKFGDEATEYTTFYVYGFRKSSGKYITERIGSSYYDHGMLDYDVTKVVNCDVSGSSGKSYINAYSRVSCRYQSFVFEYSGIYPNIYVVSMSPDDKVPWEKVLYDKGTGDRYRLYIGEDTDGIYLRRESTGGISLQGTAKVSNTKSASEKLTSVSLNFRTPTSINIACTSPVSFDRTIFPRNMHPVNERFKIYALMVSSSASASAYYMLKEDINFDANGNAIPTRSIDFYTANGSSTTYTINVTYGGVSTIPTSSIPLKIYGSTRPIISGEYNIDISNYDYVMIGHEGLYENWESSVTTTVLKPIKVQLYNEIII